MGIKVSGLSTHKKNERKNLEIMICTLSFVICVYYSPNISNSNRHSTSSDLKPETQNVLEERKATPEASKKNINRRLKINLIIYLKNKTISPCDRK